ncbi:MAG: B3/4 domain-containing protein [Bacteroidales bacterium]
MKKSIRINERLRKINPNIVIGHIEGEIEFTKYNEPLWTKIHTLCKEIETHYTTESIKQIENISTLRKTYKDCGKAPSRYRSSCEAMMRRIIQGKGLYQVNTPVDAGNLLSLEIKNSIGLFDKSKIEGDIEFRIGNQGESFKGIGRYELNMEGMPMVCDKTEGFGSPTSDSERTCIQEKTTEILLCIYSFAGRKNIEDDCKKAIDLFERYCMGKALSFNVI